MKILDNYDNQKLLQDSFIWALRMSLLDTIELYLYCRKNRRRTCRRLIIIKVIV